MTSDDFIAELERRQFLSDRLLGKLRSSLAGLDESYTAEDLADFLVQKNHLTRDQATSILESSTSSGVNLFQANASELDDDPFTGSSIFGPSPSESSGTQSEPLRVTDEDDEYRLAPLEDDAGSSSKGNVLEDE